METSSQSTALTKRSIESSLMAPPPPPKRIKRPSKVLDEEVYTSALSHIIARDFFPGLLETSTQQEYLEALDAGDQEWIQEAGSRVRQVMTPVAGGRRRGIAMTPRRSGRLAGDETLARGKAQLQQVCVARQRSKYTSEDNASFNTVLDEQNAKRAAKYAWLHNDNKLPSKRQIAQAIVHERRAIEAGDSATLILAPRPSQDQDERPASIAARPYNARNNFMFGPPSLDEAAPGCVTIAQSAQDASNAPPQSVSFSSTRLPLSGLSEQEPPDRPPSPSISAIDAAIRGAPRRTLDSTSTIAGSETPRVNATPLLTKSRPRLSSAWPIPRHRTTTSFTNSFARTRARSPTATAHNSK
ncbi:hypothetical protein MRB53_039639 [Persea americana]|nr:hypothetical protein MRB53_039639 [Persea americana]